MSHYEIYVFVLCLIVFVLFTVLFTTLLTYVVSLSVKLIRHGAEDEKLIREYEAEQKKSRVPDLIGAVLSGIICVALLAVFGFSVYLHVTEPKIPNGVPSLKVVKSSSMSYAHEGNTYLSANGLTDQIQTFDLVLTHRLPDEEDLELYDIVTYDLDGTMLIHRIIRIEEPCETHPNERWFTLRGDAVHFSDPEPVLYSQMQGIYRGDRVPFVGSFVMFMQSPAGWLCVLLVVIGMFASPILEKKVRREKEARLKAIGFLPTEAEQEDSNVPV